MAASNSIRFERTHILVSAMSILASAMSAATLEQECQAAETLTQFNSPHVVLSYPKTLGDKVSLSEVKAVALAFPDDKPDGVAPAHWKLTFPKSNVTIYVYPTSDSKNKNFAKDFPTTVSAATDLKRLIASKDVATRDIPFLPWEDASTPFSSHFKNVDFKNGSGVRFIAEYQIEPDVISNDRLIYSMQGLTKDGKYYVSALFPVSAKFLPAKSNASTWTRKQSDEFNKNFPNYLKQEKAKIDKLADDGFTPPLSVIDAMVRTIEIK